MGQYKEHFVINNRFLHLTQPSHELKCSSISFRTMNAPIFSHKLINDGPNPGPWPEISWTVRGPKSGPKPNFVARNLARNLDRCLRSGSDFRPRQGEKKS